MYESNGPDVKIRGNASHIAEKYLQLARDAQSAGDPIASESYYQHAEHYFRLIAAAQEQLRQTQPYYQQQPGGTLVAQPAPQQPASSGPVYTKWWFWTLIGVVVVGGVVTAVALGSGTSKPSCPPNVVSCSP